MDRGRVAFACILGVIALALCLSRIDAHGFWFDEAYTARLAALDWGRLVAGAQQDIHPPGWPLLEGMFARLPVTTEIALRFPSTLAFVALVVLLALRSPFAGAALLFYGPLFEQATQARPYVPLALALVALALCLERSRWAGAGLAVGVAATLHALGALLCLPYLLAFSKRSPPRARDVLRFLLPVLLLVSWWVPSFVRSASSYVERPWYTSSGAADYWIVSDGGGAALGAVLLVLLHGRREVSRFAPALAVAGTLFLADRLGFGVEIRKTGLMILPMLLASIDDGARGRIASLACMLAVAATSVRIPDRPDLREAKAAAESLGVEVPILAVFSSEASWYFRVPAPMPASREAEDIAGRIGRALDAQQASCLVSIVLPGTFPPDEGLPSGVRTLRSAQVTGLDVRVVGDSGCLLPPLHPPWTAQ